jgi:hypothetical protein
MRIYILSNINLKKNILEKLEPYFHNVRHISYIWSLNGLLQVENNKIYKIKIKDVISKKTLLGAFPITIDESEFIREEECFQVAPRSYKEYTTLKSYRLQPTSNLEWILEYKDDELHDNYFNLPATEDIHSAKIKGEILEFLNM